MIKTFLKFLFASIIIFWLLQKGQLDFSFFSTLQERPFIWLFAGMILTLNICLTSLRWKFLLDSMCLKPLPLWPVIRTTWIGQFFNSVLPGVVTGDLIKLLYARDLDRSLSKTFLLTTIMLDRIFGLQALILLGGAVSLFHYEQLCAKSPLLASLVHTNLMLMAASLLFLFSIMIPSSVQQRILDMLCQIPKLGQPLCATLQQTWSMGHNPPLLIKTFAISFFNHLANMFTFWMLALPFIQVDFPFTHALMLFPIGLITVALPISPAGLGVGHAAFATLFSLFGITQGASLFNLFFVLNITINLCGALAYLTASKKYSLHDTQETK